MKVKVRREAELHKPRGRRLTVQGMPTMPPMGDVYVLDAWDEVMNESYVRVFASKEKAQRELAKILKQPGRTWYAGIVKRKIL